MASASLGNRRGKLIGDRLDDLVVAQHVEDGDANPRRDLEERQIPGETADLDGMEFLGHEIFLSCA